jgi:hypothetical protein
LLPSIAPKLHSARDLVQLIPNTVARSDVAFVGRILINHGDVALLTSLAGAVQIEAADNFSAKFVTARTKRC